METTRRIGLGFTEKIVAKQNAASILQHSPPRRTPTNGRDFYGWGDNLGLYQISPPPKSTLDLQEKESVKKQRVLWTAQKTTQTNFYHNKPRQFLFRPGVNKRKKMSSYFPRTTYCTSTSAPRPTRMSCGIRTRTQHCLWVFHLLRQLNTTSIHLQDEQLRQSPLRIATRTTFTT